MVAPPTNGVSLTVPSQGQDSQGQDSQPKDPSFRPRFSLRLASAIKRAAAFSNLTVPMYIETVLAPLVYADLKNRIDRARDEFDNDL